MRRRDTRKRPSRKKAELIAFRQKAAALDLSLQAAMRLKWEDRAIQALLTIGTGADKALNAVVAVMMWAHHQDECPAPRRER